MLGKNFKNFSKRYVHSEALWYNYIKIKESTKPVENTGGKENA